MAILPSNPNEDLPNNESENQSNAGQDKVSNEGDTSDGEAAINGVPNAPEDAESVDNVAGEDSDANPSEKEGSKNEPILLGDTEATEEADETPILIGDDIIGEVADKAPETPTMKRYLLDFAGRGNDYFFIAFRGYALTVLTLGLYYPWARVQRMRYMLNNLWLDGSPFVFEAKGKEVFKGFIKVYAILAVLGLFYLYGLIAKEFWIQSLMPLIFAGFGFLITPLAIHGSMRYRTSKTSWKGIYFHYTGSLGALYSIYLKNILLTIITAGIYGTWAQVNLLKYLAENLQLGNIELKYKADGTKIFVRGFVTGLISYGVGMVLMIFVVVIIIANSNTVPSITSAETFGSVAAIFVAVYFVLLLSILIGVVNFKVWHMHYNLQTTIYRLGNLVGKIEDKIDLSKLTRFEIINGLLIILTLGIGTPFVAIRRMQMYTNLISFLAPFDFDNVVQTGKEYNDAFGEDLGDQFDIQLDLM